MEFAALIVLLLAVSRKLACGILTSTRSPFVYTSVVDPNTLNLNLDPDPGPDLGFWHNLDPDPVPDPG